MMKKCWGFYFLFLATGNISAQDNDVSVVIGHLKKQFYVVKQDDYYFMEELSLLKYNHVIYDTLRKVGAANTFKGRTHALVFTEGIPRLGWLRNKGATQRYSYKVLSEMDGDAVKERIRKHNFLYYVPYEVKIAERHRLLSASDKNAYDIFAKDRAAMYQKIDVMGIGEFRVYFDEFVRKYALK